MQRRLVDGRFAVSAMDRSAMRCGALAHLWRRLRCAAQVMHILTRNNRTRMCTQRTLPRQRIRRHRVDGCQPIAVVVCNGPSGTSTDELTFLSNGARRRVLHLTRTASRKIFPRRSLLQLAAPLQIGRRRGNARVSRPAASAAPCNSARNWSRRSWIDAITRPVGIPRPTSAASDS